MPKRGPGKYYRDGITIMELLRMFPDNKTAEKWFEKCRWPDGIRCAHCDSDRVNLKAKHPQMPYHCRACRKYFSVKIGTPIQSSNMGYQKWAIAFYMMTTGIKDLSSMKLHHEIGIRQATAWHMGHRIRETWDDRPKKFNGLVETDEMFVGGKEANKHTSKKLNAGRGPVGKTPVVGMRDRETGLIEAEVLENSTADTMNGFVSQRAETGAKVYTDTGKTYSKREFDYPELLDEPEVTNGDVFELR